MISGNTPNRNRSGTGITRGTTPSIPVTVPMNLDGYTCYLSIGRKPHEPYVTVDNSQMQATYGNTSHLMFTLTQSQTLSCKPGKACVQLRFINGDTAYASTIGEIEIFDVVKDGEIQDAY